MWARAIEAGCLPTPYIRTFLYAYSPLRAASAPRNRRLGGISNNRSNFQRITPLFVAKSLDTMYQNPDICALNSSRYTRLANSAQARKRARQNSAARQHNASQRSALRTSIKSFLKTVEGGDVEASRAAYTRTVSAIDRGVNKGLHHKNRAARLKSRLNNRLRALNG